MKPIVMGDDAHINKTVELITSQSIKDVEGKRPLGRVEGLGSHIINLSPIWPYGPLATMTEATAYAPYRETRIPLSMTDVEND